MVEFDDSLFDEIFADGAVTEPRIDSAAVVVKNLADTNKDAGRKAEKLLGELLLLAIADGRCANPQRCAGHYFEMMRAAFGEPTLLDSVKERFGKQ